MDDLGAALGSILSNPAAMEKLSGLASQLGLGGDAETPPCPPPEPVLPRGCPPEQDPKLGRLLCLAGDMGKEDDTTRLLEALKPFLSPERQEKVDRAIRAARLMRLAKTFCKTVEL